MGREPFDEMVFWNIRGLKAWVAEPALVFPKPAGSLWSSVLR